MTILYTSFWKVQIPENAFWIEEESRHLSEKIDQTCEKYRGAIGIPDDVQVFGNDETHNDNLHEAMSTYKNVH